MAETVLSMARSMLGGAISMATSAATVEIGRLMGVQKDILFIKHELETMQAFLKDADRRKEKDELLKVWAKQVKDLSYNIEDCLGEFVVYVESKSKSLPQRLMKLKDRIRIARQIHHLKSRVEEVSLRNIRYNSIMTEASSTISEVDSYIEDVRNHVASNTDEAELVGFSKPKEELIELMDVKSKDGIAKVICVVGMGGLGKTTLARKIYESKEDIVKKFSCCAWITVSQTFLKIEMLKDMIIQLLGNRALEQCLRNLKGKTVRVDDLATYLRGKLEEKRYLVVLDDLWTIGAWEWINSIVFPRNNKEGSRIIVTTRDVGLARQFTLESLIYHLKALEPVDATYLLLKKARKTQEDIDNDENLKKLVEQLVRKCGCLPLAILTIGGILANKKIAEWEYIYNQLPSELESNPSLEAIRSIVTLSYNFLPSHLKSCFLYLSIFPEDFEIQRRRLVERWIVEGFVIARDGANIEDVGKSYFNELINRSMIIPSRVNIEGSVKSCRVHDILRDVMVSISRDESFVYFVGANIAKVPKENFCHVAYHSNKCQKIKMDWSHVRSLTVFGERPILKVSPSIFSLNLRMLRVLDLADAKFNTTKEDFNNIGLLRHLKYVNIREVIFKVHELPGSIGKLHELQTLAIEKSSIRTLPTEISKLQNLRSLRCNSEMKGVSVPRGIGKLKELEILEVVSINRTSSSEIEELGELMQLRKLTVKTNGATEEKCKIFCAAVEKLSSLCCLDVNSHDDVVCSVGTVEWVHCISSPPPLLRTLYLTGRLREMPDWVRSLRHLVKIHLWCSHLRSMEILGALPSLMLLLLSNDAYVERELVFTAGAFPNLRNFKFQCLVSVTEVRFEEGTSPHMERIEIDWCRLASGIVGIEHLPSLKEIELVDDSGVAKLDVLQGEMAAHPNHPVLRLDRWHYHLGDSSEETSAAEETCAAGERSQVVISTTNVSEDDLFYTYNSC